MRQCAKGTYSLQSLEYQLKPEELREVFALSKMTIVNEKAVFAPVLYWSHEFVEFIEFIARVSLWKFKYSQRKRDSLACKVEKVLKRVLPKFDLVFHK